MYICICICIYIQLLSIESIYNNLGAPPPQYTVVLSIFFLTCYFISHSCFCDQKPPKHLLRPCSDVASPAYMLWEAAALPDTWLPATTVPARLLLGHQHSTCSVLLHLHSHQLLSPTTSAKLLRPQCSSLGNLMHRGAWWAAVHGIT